MSKISPCLWFESQAEESANFYVSLLPNSRIDHVQKSPADYPGGKKGAVLIVAFTLAGETYQALNGGEAMAYTNAISLSVECGDQQEVDRLWDGLSAGGSLQQCGWLRDRYGIPWQVVPKALPHLLADPDLQKAQQVMETMMTMVKLDVATLQRAYDGAA